MGQTRYADVVLMDVNGIEATRHIATHLPHITVIGLSVQDADSTAAAMKNAGAVAYHTKDGESNDLLETIRRIATRRSDQNA